MTRLLLLAALPLALSAQVVSPPASTVFDKDQVHEIRLTFKQAGWYEQLLADYDQFPDNTPYREASLEWGANKFETIGVRFKGNSSYRGATTKKKPFRIKLNEFVKGQKIDGMASFGLSNAWSDPSFVREKPYYEMAAAIGLAAARSSFAALYINGEYWGLYILGEIVNGDFLKSHFAKGDDGGNLYKATEPGANLAYLGENPAAYRNTFSKESNEEADDWTDLIELARVFEQTPIAELSTKLDKLIDVDSFLTALALDNMTVNLDSYVGMAQNYYLYRRPSDQRWAWIPWDPSLAFGAHSQGLTVQQMKNLVLEWARTGGSTARPIATKLWQVPAYKQRYRAIYRDIFEKQMSPAQVVGRMNALRDLIRPWVEKDTQKLVTQAQFDAAMMSDATAAPGQGSGAPGLQPFIEGRAASIRLLLEGQPILLSSASPPSLFFAATSGSVGGSQTVALALSDSSKTAPFTAVTPAPWLTVDAANGTIPSNLRISASAAGLGTGTYSGTVQLTAPTTGNNPLTIPVVMSVATGPSIETDPSSLTWNSAGGQAALTATIAVASTVGGSPFTVIVTDATCANFLSVTPLSGTTPATLTVRATPVPGRTDCSGRINIASNGLATAVVPVSLTVPGEPGELPSVSAILNGASYAEGAVSPGTIVTIFGTNIGPRDLAAGAFVDGQFTTTVGGVRVTFDGTPAPVLYARFNQVGVIVPFEVAGRTQTSVQLAVNGQAAPPLQVPVAPSSPGIFTAAGNGSGQASVINQDNAINGPNAPAAKGSIIAIYFTGAGLLTPAGRTGAPGTANQSIAESVTVTIGGIEASIAYKGAAPGQVQGLYQINATVPQETPSGSIPLQVKVGTADAQRDVTIYVQ